MIIPLEVRLEKVDKPEAFETEFYGELEIDVKPPIYRVKAIMIDVDREITIEYEFHSMIDPTQPAGQEIGVVKHTDIKHHRKYLTKLRDQLDRALGEP